jgi:hypothetical protein
MSACLCKQHAACVVQSACTRYDDRLPSWTPLCSSCYSCTASRSKLAIPLLQSELNMVWESVFVQAPYCVTVGTATLVVSTMPTRRSYPLS